MNTAQGVIIVLLVLAMVFSGVSIYIGLSALGLESGPSSVSGNVVGENSGGVSFYVESSEVPGGAG